MPNILDDGLLDQAWVSRKFSDLPTNSDFLLQSAVGSAINTASATGAYTCTVATASYANALVQALMQRLVNMGYTTSLSGTTLTVNWSVY